MNRSLGIIPFPFAFLREDIPNVLHRCFDCGISTDAVESSIAWAVFDPDSDGQNGIGEVWATDMTMVDEFSF